VKRDEELARSSGEEQPVTAQTSARPATAKAPSIVVLPFSNMSSDPENEFFADGITEEIINALAQINGLRVAARTSAFSFKGKHVDLRTVGESLNVTTVLEGSVRKSGNRLRITAQLINAADGYHLWAERYDRELQDIFEVQDEIAKTIAGRLRIAFDSWKHEPLVKVGTKKHGGLRAVFERALPLEQADAGRISESSRILSAGRGERSGICAGLCGSGGCVLAALLFQCVSSSRTDAEIKSGGRESAAD
jgi:TolB-like protein